MRVSTVPGVWGPFLASLMSKSDLLSLVSAMWSSSKMCYIVFLARIFQVYPPLFVCFRHPAVLCIYQTVLGPHLTIFDFKLFRHGGYVSQMTDLKWAVQINTN